MTIMSVVCWMLDAGYWLIFIYESRPNRHRIGNFASIIFKWTIVPYWGMIHLDAKTMLPRWMYSDIDFRHPSQMVRWTESLKPSTRGNEFSMFMYVYRTHVRINCQKLFRSIRNCCCGDITKKDRQLDVYIVCTHIVHTPMHTCMHIRWYYIRRCGRALETNKRTLGIIANEIYYNVGIISQF